MGPSGRTDLYVNGIAASIELYLGEDVLTNGEGQLSPVQWTGFDRGMNQYQGEVLGKPELHKRFRQKLERWDDHSGPQWDSLRAVLQVISTAFDEQRGKVICGLPNDYSSR